MGVLCAEAGEDTTAMGGFGVVLFGTGSLIARIGEPGCVSARSGEMKNSGPFGDVATTVAGHHPRRNEKSLSEDGGLIRPALAGAIFQDNDLVVGLMRRLNLRINGAAGDPEPAGR